MKQKLYSFVKMRYFDVDLKLIKIKISSLNIEKLSLEQFKKAKCVDLL
jgi:hypothetical protein